MPTRKEFLSKLLSKETPSSPLTYTEPAVARLADKETISVFVTEIRDLTTKLLTEVRCRQNLSRKDSHDLVHNLVTCDDLLWPGDGSLYLSNILFHLVTVTDFILADSKPDLFEKRWLERWTSSVEYPQRLRQFKFTRVQVMIEDWISISDLSIELDYRSRDDFFTKESLPSNLSHLLNRPESLGILIGIRDASFPHLPKWSVSADYRIFCDIPPLPPEVSFMDWSRV